MAPYTFIFSSLLIFLLSSSSVTSQQSFRLKALLISLSKDASTLQYVTQIKQRTPLIPINLVLHLGGKFLWVDCDQNYISSTYKPAPCGSALCSLGGADGCGNCFSPPRPGCNNNTCGVSPDNPITNTATGGELATDIVSVNSTNGSNPGRAVTVPKFLFSCAPTFLLRRLANGFVGLAGLGRTRAALPSQFSSSFSFNRKFAICLSPGNGVIFFGDGPYNFLPNVQFTSKGLTYTPLLVNPVSTAPAFTQGEPSAEYFIGVKSIMVNDKKVTLNDTLLTIDSQGNGGTKISIVNPYTVLESSIFTAVTKAFITEAAAMNISRVSGVKQFEVCFSSNNVVSTNSIVQVSDDVVCLGVINGGSKARTSIVIGGYQLENNLVEFDLATSRLGFSSLLFGRQTTCSNFNFTSIS